jgi:hypothetical protein
MKLASRSSAKVGTLLALLASPLSVITAFAEDDGAGPRIHEERHSLEGLPIIIVISALIIAVGLAYGIGRRSHK